MAQYSQWRVFKL